MVRKLKALFQKLNNLSPAAKASFWFVISNIALKGISFITTPIFTRLMEVEDYGATSVFVTWENVISIFATLSLAGGVYNVAQAKYGDDINAFTSCMLTLSFIVSVFVYSVCILINTLYPSLFGLNNLFLGFMWLQTFTNAVVTFWLMRRRYIYAYKSVITYTLLSAVLNPVIAIIGVLCFSDYAVYAKLIGSGIFGILFGLVICIITYVKGKKFASKKYWGYALRFNLPLLPHYLSSILLNSSDKLMIDRMVSTACAGIYSIAHSITALVSIITQAINSALIPFTLQSIKAKNYSGLKNVLTACTALVAVVCVGLVLFAKEGIMIFATKEYMDAVWFIPPLAMATLFSFIYGILGNIMFYYEKTWQMSLITIVCAVINLVSNYFCIKYFGYIAAGYTTLLCSAIQMLACYFVVRKYEKNLKQILDLRWFFLIIVSYTIIMVYAIIFLESFWARLGLLVVVFLAILILRKKIIAMFSAMMAKKKKGEPLELEEINKVSAQEPTSMREATVLLDKAGEDE